MSTLRAIVLPPGLALPSVVELEQEGTGGDTSCLKGLQHHIGGYVECWDHEDVTLWWDEEYLYKPDREPNIYATTLLQGQVNMGGGAIGGTVVVTGQPDRRGVTRPVPEEWVQKINAMLAEK